MIRALLCLFGFHHWQIVREESVEGVYDEGPVLFECGGVDYHLRCACCSAERVEACRGVWRTPDYPKAAP